MHCGGKYSTVLSILGRGGQQERNSPHERKRSRGGAAEEQGRCFCRFRQKLYGYMGISSDFFYKNPRLYRLSYQYRIILLYLRNSHFSCKEQRHKDYSRRSSVFKKIGRCDPDSQVRRGNLKKSWLHRPSGLYSVGAITT